MTRAALLLLGGVSLVAAGCGDAAGRSAADGKLRVIVSIPPQAFFAEQVGGPLIDLEVLVAPGQSPHHFEPTPQQVARVSSADVLFTIGVGFERGFVPSLRDMNPKLTVVDTRAGITLRPMADACCAAHGAPGHTHGHEGEPAGEGDPHIWLDPRLVKVQARTMADALARLDPANASTYRRNASDFATRLDALHDALATRLAPYRNREFFVFHPAYGYFADAYGLRQVPVEVNGREPSAQELTELIKRARASGVRTVFYQPQYSSKSAQAVADAIGGKIVPMDELARDYVTNLHQMADDLIRSFSATPS